MQSNKTYTTTTDRPTYVDRHDNLLTKMILPFIIGLALGWGANEMADSANNNANDNDRQVQSESR